MNPTEVYQFIVGLIHSGAEVMAAALMALVTGLFGGWKFGSWMVARDVQRLRKERDNERERLFKEREKVNQLTGQLAMANHELVTLRAEFKIEVEKEVGNRIGPIKADLDKTRSDLDAKTKLVERYLRDGNRARDLVKDLQGQLEAATGQIGELQGKLTTTEEKLSLRTAQHEKSVELLLQTRRLLDDEQKCTLQLRHELEQEQERGRKFARDAETHQQIAEKLESKYTATEIELNRTRQSLDEEQKKVHALEQIIQSSQAYAGKIWRRPIPPDAPPFVPLGEKRRCPIISLLNLKGGVGKTTLTLNLAATLSERGKRILMIDCDHQRSLSALCLPQQRIISLHYSQQTLQHFMRGPERSVKVFLNCVQNLNNLSACASVINTTSHEDEDGLASVEEKLMLDWMLSHGKDDVRHALRAVLHSEEIAERFDYVFLDCPPRLSTVAVNAIAASDYVLIPVVPDRISATQPLPLLLRELRRLHTSNFFPHFNILGIVANRVHMRNGKMVRNQLYAWESLHTLAAASWGEPVHRFETKILQASAYESAAKVLLNDTESAVVIKEDAGAKTLFSTLTDEIEQRILEDTNDNYSHNKKRSNSQRN